MMEPLSYPFGDPESLRAPLTPHFPVMAFKQASPHVAMIVVHKARVFLLMGNHFTY